MEEFAKWTPANCIEHDCGIMCHSHLEALTGVSLVNLCLCLRVDPWIGLNPTDAHPPTCCLQRDWLCKAPVRTAIFVGQQ